MADVFADGELRMRGAALRAEWRDEEEAWTRAALEHWEHSRSLPDVALDCMHRGDSVAITAAGVVLAGRVAAVGVDTLRLVNGQGHVDVALDERTPIVLRVDATNRGEGTSGAASASTFRTRLLEHEACACVSIGVVTIEGSLTGGLRTGSDHVRMRSRDEIDTFVPLRSVVWVREHHGS